MALSYDLIADCKNDTGESPLWSSAEQALYWVDIPAGKMFRWNAQKGLQSWQSTQMTACIMLHESSGLIVFQEDQINQVSLLDDGRIEQRNLYTIEHPYPGMRFNDGCCCRHGHSIWVSSMQKTNAGARIGSLYRFTGQQLLPHLDGLCTPNGLAFSPDGRTMYASDSHPSVRKIWAFDYDVDDGVPSNKRLFVDMNQYPGRPDGATIDVDGCYWICAADSGLVLRFSPKGDLVNQYALPVKKPTNCIFGGPNMDTLFVTSLRPSGVDLSDQPLAGGVFALHPGIQGLREPIMKVRNA